MRLPAAKPRRLTRSPRQRGGSLTVELLLVFPILLGLLFGMIEFSMLLLARQQLVAASREGARTAALGGDLADVKATVKRYLGPGRLGDAEVGITDLTGQPLRAAQAVPSGEPVQVWLRLPANHAVPDLLRFVGFSIREEELIARTVMRRE